MVEINAEDRRHEASREHKIFTLYQYFNVSGPALSTRFGKNGVTIYRIIKAECTRHKVPKRAKSKPQNYSLY